MGATTLGRGVRSTPGGATRVARLEPRRAGRRCPRVLGKRCGPSSATPGNAWKPRIVSRGPHAVGGLVEDLADDYADLPEVSALTRTTCARASWPTSACSVPTRAGPRGGTGSRRCRSVTRCKPSKRAPSTSTRSTSSWTTATRPVSPSSSSPTRPTRTSSAGSSGKRSLCHGALLTDLTLIRPGALHRAEVAGHPLSARARRGRVARAALLGALERSLREGSVTIEEAGEALGSSSTRGLEPDPIPLDVARSCCSAYYQLSSRETALTRHSSSCSRSVRTSSNGPPPVLPPPSGDRG